MRRGKGLTFVAALEVFRYVPGETYTAIEHAAKEMYPGGYTYGTGGVTKEEFEFYYPGAEWEPEYSPNPHFQWFSIWGWNAQGIPAKIAFIVALPSLSTEDGTHGELTLLCERLNPSFDLPSAVITLPAPITPKEQSDIFTWAANSVCPLGISTIEEGEQAIKHRYPGG